MRSLFRGSALVTCATLITTLVGCTNDPNAPEDPFERLVQFFSSFDEVRAVPAGQTWSAEAFGYDFATPPEPVAGAGDQMSVLLGDTPILGSLDVIGTTNSSGAQVSRSGVRFDLFSNSPAMTDYTVAGGTEPRDMRVIYVGSTPRPTELPYFNVTGTFTPQPSQSTCGGVSTDVGVVLNIRPVITPDGSIVMEFENGDRMNGSVRDPFWMFSSQSEAQISTDLFATETWTLLGDYMPPASPTDNVVLYMTGTSRITFRFADQGNQTCDVVADMKLEGELIPRFTRDF